MRNSTGVIRMTVTCEECGTKWVYERCFVCGGLADEEELTDAKTDLRRRGIPD